MLNPETFSKLIAGIKDIPAQLDERGLLQLRQNADALVEACQSGATASDAQADDAYGWLMGSANTLDQLGHERTAAHFIAAAEAVTPPPD